MTRLLLSNLFEDLDEYPTFFNKHKSNSCCESQNSRGLSISEDNHKIYIEAPVPGVKPEDIEVTLDPKSRKLLIHAEVKEQREVKYHIRGQKSFYYELPLSNEMKSDKINAICKDGVLHIDLEKSPANKPLKIDVKVA